MGLDQYLSENVNLGRGYDFMEETVEGRAETALANNVLEFLGMDIPTVAGSVTVSVTVGYWRKANQIHNWFVQNVQGGEDDCNAYDVSEEQLEELRDLCEKVLSSVETTIEERSFDAFVAGEPTLVQVTEKQRVILNPEICEKLLPTADGFFYGGVEYDEWYLRDLEDTVEQLNTILARPKGKGRYRYFSYQASW